MATIPATTECHFANPKTKSTAAQIEKKARGVGRFGSTDFPITPGAFQTTCSGGCNFPGDVVITELNPTGSALVYSTYLGGSNSDQGNSIAVDASGNVYVIGFTDSTDFPTTPGAFQMTCGSCTGNGNAAFVTKFVPGDQVWPLSLDFGNQNVGTRSAPQKTIISNSGDTELRITNITITGTDSGDFSETNNCPASLPAGKSCTIRATFKPTAPGTRTAAVSIMDSAPNSPQTVSLAGFATQPTVIFSPASLTFPDQVVFSSSPAQPVKLTNTGNGPLDINSITVTGPFSETNNCGKSVEPGDHCTINVKFRPKTKGVQQGAVSVTDDAPGSPQKVPLTGTGTFVQLTPAKLNFGTQPVGTRSLPKTITLTNKGDSAVNIQSISIAGLNAGDFAERNNCGRKVASGASCFIKVTFKPLVKGKRTADISVRDDGGGSPQQAKLIGTGT